WMNTSSALSGSSFSRKFRPRKYSPGRPPVRRVRGRELRPVSQPTSKATSSRMPTSSRLSVGISYGQVAQVGDFGLERPQLLAQASVAPLQFEQREARDQHAQQEAGQHRHEQHPGQQGFPVAEEVVEGNRRGVQRGEADSGDEQQNEQKRDQENSWHNGSWFTGRARKRIKRRCRPASVRPHVRARLHWRLPPGSPG